MIVVRPATEADAAAIGRVHVDTWRTTYAGLLPDTMLIGMSDVRRAAYWQQVIAQHAEREDVLVAVDRQHGVIGFGSCGPARALPEDIDAAWRDAGEIYTLYVSPDFQNAGTGRRLLAGLMSRLVERGFGAAVLWVLASNPSRFFYERMGGRRLGVQVEHHGEHPIEETAYGWADLLGAAAALAAAVRADLGSG